MTNDKHHDIDKLFQNAFESYETPPPFNMWDKIEDNLPLTETDLLFKNAFENYEKEPSPEVWENIKPELPLSLTLRNVFMKLSRVAAVVLFIITGFVFVQQSNWGSDNNEMAQTQQQIIVEENEAVAQQEYYNEEDVLSDEVILDEPIAMLEDVPTTSNTEVTIAEATINSPFNNPNNVAKGGTAILIKKDKNVAKAAVLNISEIAKRVQNGDNSRIPSAELFEVTLVEQEEPSKVDTIKEKTDELKILRSVKMEDAVAVRDFDGKIRRPYKGATTQTTNPLYLSLQGKPDAGFNNNGLRIKRSALELEAFNFKGLYLTANAALGSSAMLNDVMKQEVIGTNANYNLVSTGSNFGIGMGYQFTSKWSVETGLNYVNQNQTYSNAENADNINLDYYAIPVTMKFRSNEISGKKPSAISYIFGVQTAFLGKAPKIINNIPVSTPQAHDVAIKTELGVTTGVDYDLFLNPNLSWTIGARATVGTDVNNAFENYNTFVGVRTAVNFRFTK